MFSDGFDFFSDCTNDHCSKEECASRVIRSVLEEPLVQDWNVFCDAVRKIVVGRKPQLMLWSIQITTHENFFAVPH